MISNPVIECMLDHRSVRKYTDQMPDDETIETVVRAGQQAPFAYQMYSVILTKEREKHPFKAPLLFTLCVDVHKFERIMEKRGWKTRTNNLTLLLFGIEDASYMAQNMVVAARSLGLGSCFIGRPLAEPEPYADKYHLPERVYPIVQLAMGYPDEEFPTRPRYPLEFTLFEDRYPELTDEIVEKAMAEMDDWYLAQEYYERLNARIPLQDREETYDFDTYSWTEHICRKVGQWLEDLDEQKKVIEGCGFKT